MPEFYHNLVTDKSFRLLQELKRRFDFVLIGDWAVFLYTRALKSKDIDIVIDYPELDKLRREHELFKNDRLKKYEIKIEEVDVDIYLPHYSDLGLPVEEVRRHSRSLEGFQIPELEVLLLLKVQAARERQGSGKGRKNAIDVFSLLMQETQKINWAFYGQLVQEYDLSDLHVYLQELVAGQGNLPELGLGSHKLARLKKGVLQQLKGVC